MLCADMFAPSPAIVAPKLSMVVTICVDERGELFLRDSFGADGKRPDVYRVLPLFIIKDERLVTTRT
jgi:hypothetical protein